MKAIVYDRYGPPHVLEYREVDRPEIGIDSVLVKVYAASINAADKHLVRGTPFIVRLLGLGLFNPKKKILGSDMAGRVEAIGKNVKHFVPGDEVFGDLSGCGFGAFAEYVSVPENVLLTKPANMTFMQAATMPLAAVTALQGLRDKGKIKPGSKVLINGASGGVGSFAVQIAKTFGAEVTGVCSTAKLDMVRALGADYVVDYTRHDFTREQKVYDLILDLAVERSMAAYKRVLSSQGICVAVGGSALRLLQLMLRSLLILATDEQKVLLLSAKPDKQDLLFIKSLAESGKLVPVISKCYSLSETADALAFFEGGKGQGKIVITSEI